MPFVAVVIAIMTARRRRWAVGRWALAGIAAAVLAVPAIYTQLVLGLIVGLPLVNAAGYSWPADGLPYFPGVFIVAVAVAMLVAAGVVPGVRFAARMVSPAPTVSR